MVNVKNAIKNMIIVQDDMKRHLPLDVTVYEPAFSNLPAEFDGFKIALLTDLHGCWHPELLSELKKEKPDLIVLGGDFFDGVYPAQEAQMLLDELEKTSYIAGVSGNHEKYRNDWPMLREMTSSQVRWLEDEQIFLGRNKAKIRLLGLEDPGNLRGRELNAALARVQNTSGKIPECDLFTIALIHRPAFGELVDRPDFDLILSGHTHGGQWRVFGHGIAGPGLQDKIDLFPKYDGGLYQLHHSRMAVSRGMGDQMWIPRIFNNPELVILKLRRKQER